MANAQPDPFIGRLIENRFEIVSLLGRGGMAVVYKAQHRQVELTVAVKILHRIGDVEEVNVERFKREARTVNSLFHPNIITMYSFGVLESGQPYLVLECLEGESLSDRIKSGGPIKPAIALRIFDEIGQGVVHAHEQGVLHRDLKPSNIMLVPDQNSSEKVKILDFGIAKCLHPDGANCQQLTSAGEIFGSPLYMSPEQCQGEDLDERSDVYAMGCVMYEVLTGKVPLMGKNVLATMALHINEMPPRFENIGVQIPPPLEMIVFKALQKKPSDRYQTMSELVSDLEYASV